MAPFRAEVSALVVSPPAPIWGAQLYLLDQVDALRDRGVRLTLGSPRGSDFADEWERRGHVLHDLPITLHTSMRVAGTNGRPGPVTIARTGGGVIANCWHIARAARSYDMLSSFSLRSHLETAVAGRLARTPTALDLVDIVRPGVGQKVLRRAASLAQLTVANSTATASVLGAKPAVQIIHPGIDLDRFHPGPPPAALRAELCCDPHAPLVGIACRLDVRKGVQILVDAMTQLQGCACATHSSSWSATSALARQSSPRSSSSMLTTRSAIECASSVVVRTWPTSCERSMCSSLRPNPNRSA